MSDPRLCSIHLDALPRRQEYRRARELLLGNCGQRTLALDGRQLAEALAEGILTGHRDMPEFHFPPSDINAIIHYLQSIQTRQHG